MSQYDATDRRILHAALNHRIQTKADAEAARMAEIERDRERELLYGFKAAHAEQEPTE